MFGLDALIKYGIILAVVAVVATSIYGTWVKYVANPYRKEGEAVAVKVLQPQVDKAKATAVEQETLRKAAESQRDELEQQVIAAAARVEAVVHAIMVTPASEPASAWQRRSVDAVRELAFSTGGRVHPLKQAYNDFNQIVEDFRSGYVLRYMPERVPTDGVHEVAVTLQRPDANRYVVRARKTYFGG